MKPTRRLSAVDRWIIVFVVALVAVFFVINHYKQVNGNPVGSVVVFVIFLVIYVWPTAIALRSSGLHGFIRYLFGLTAVPLFVALLVASVHLLSTEMPAFSQGYWQAQESGRGHRIQVLAIIAAAPAAFILWLWYRALAIIDRLMFRPGR